MDRAVVVVAAGSGTRLGIGTAKAFVPVAGRLMLTRALEPLFALAAPALVVVVAPADRLDECRQVVADVAGAAVGYTAVVPGGTDRHASVQAGLAALPDSVDVVLVHDAARCLTPATQFERVFDTVTTTGDGVVPALPVVDTVKRVDGDVVLETVDRSALVGVQTPQGFPLAALRQAYAVSERSETDDAGVFQAAGRTVRFVPGDADAFKITTAWDLGRAESVVRARAGAEQAGCGSASGSTCTRSTRPRRAGSGCSTSRGNRASPDTATATRSRTRCATRCSRPAASGTSADASARPIRGTPEPPGTSSCGVRSSSSRPWGWHRRRSRSR